MKQLTFSTCPATPWKNGGGLTFQRFILPHGAGLDDFQLRLSMASVTSDGPFSLYPGVDRQLLILEGAGLVLRGEDLGERQLTAQTQTLHFPGEWQIASNLLDGRVLDFNLMVRRGGYRAQMQSCHLTGDSGFTAEADITLLLFLAPCQLGPNIIARYDLLQLAAGEQLRLDPAQAVAVIKTELWK
jgi:uncharacterized protein